MESIGGCRRAQIRQDTNFDRYGFMRGQLYIEA